MKLLAVVVLLAASTVAPGAQTKGPKGLTDQPNQTDSALTAQTRRAFESVSENILKAARAMPETSYGFKAADGTRTFGELVAHIADVQGTLCGNMNNHPVKAAHASSKDGRIQDLQSSIVQCNSAFSELSAENMNKPVQTPAGQLTHLAALMYIITHASEEYGELALSLRINHLAPPTSDEPKHVT